MLEKLKDQVAQCLKEHAPNRDSDITLTIDIWNRFYSDKVKVLGGEKVVALRDLYDLPREDNVKRIRAKFAEEALKRIAENTPRGDEEYYIPTSWAVAEQRGINAATWQKALGYFRSRLPQTEQLPRPVGNIGFSLIKRDFEGEHYEAEGADHKKHKVFRSGDFWKCSCEAYKFSYKVKTCKHIKAIKQFLSDTAKQEAANQQRKIF